MFRASIAAARDTLDDTQAYHATRASFDLMAPSPKGARYGIGRLPHLIDGSPAVNTVPLTAKISVLSGGAMQGLLAEAVPLFERGNGCKVAVEIGLTSALRKAIGDGAAFDIALLPRADIDALAGGGRIAIGQVTDIARSAIGVAVRAGAPKPDIATVDAFKRAVLQAASVTYSDGPSGLYIAGLMERLGLAEAIKPKTRLTTGPVAELLARGEAELGLQQIVAILPVKGAELVGPLPGELQNIIVYAAGISAQSASVAPARAFIAFMGTPEVARIIRAKGLEPG
jgi:molybdate transport system substrate-binding protein